MATKDPDTLTNAGLVLGGIVASIGAWATGAKVGKRNGTEERRETEGKILDRLTTLEVKVAQVVETSRDRIHAVDQRFDQVFDKLDTLIDSVGQLKGRTER